MEQAVKNSLLIVDDERMNLMVLTDILKSDYTIYTATGGREAINKIKEFKPDLVLLDIIMPDMDGFQTLYEINECEHIKDTPVIFITGLTSVEDEEKAMSMNASDYITKPFSASIVKIRVRNQIQLINQLRMMENLTLIDTLTDLPNRRSFNERLIMEWRQAIREKTPLSLLMIDVDNFKNFNDKYGHQQGDVVLKTIGGVFSKIIKRPGDFAARWGGEEFMILLPNTHVEGAMDIAGKLCAEISNTGIPHEGDSVIKVTVSIGVHSLVPTVNDSVEDFIDSSDKALYAAKDAGRNTVVLYAE